MKIIDFLKEYADRRNGLTKVVLKWYWVDEGIDEIYCFEGSPSEYIEKYTQVNFRADSLDVFDVHEMKIINKGVRSKIYIEIVAQTDF